MADLTISAANVLAGTNAKKKTGTAGATVTAGQPVYADSADGFKYKPAQANAATTDKVEGIALHGALDEQPLTIVTEDDDFTSGGTMVVGQTYVLSAAAAGGIAPISDLVSTNLVALLGVAKSATKLRLQILNAETAKA